MRILVIESDPMTANAIKMMLNSANMQVYTCDTGGEAIELAEIYDYDMITSEIDLPDTTGHNVLRQIRAAKITTPFMMLTSMDDTENKLKAFGFGADDYMTKPFHRAELIARITAIVRRANGHATTQITTGDMIVDLDRRSVTVAGKPVHLTGKEFAILELLSMRKGVTMTKDMLLNHLYGDMDEPETRIIDVFVCKLRKKLGDAGKHVETVWSRGYTLRDQL